MLIKKIFIRLVTSILSAANHKKCESLRNQKCLTQPTLISLHPDEYSQELHYYLFAAKQDGCTGNFYTLDDLSDNVCVSPETEK